jgi:hypothetical protein
MEMFRAVDLAPASVDGLGECLAVAARSARVWIENVEPFVGECEHLQPGGGPVRGMRTAMDLDDDRTGSWRIPSLDQPAVVVMAFGMSQSMTNRIAAVRFEPVRAIAREPAHGAILDGVDLRGPPPITFTGIEGSTTRREHNSAAMCAGVERQFALLNDAIEARDGVLFNSSSLHTDSTTPGSAACEHANTGRTQELLSGNGFVARELVTVDPEIRREGALKKGWPSGHPSPDCFGS